MASNPKTTGRRLPTPKLSKPDLGRTGPGVLLARLGRKPEAVQALEPFARGDYGPYRQVEASALVKALSAPQ
jgi:hypothetical protein